MHLGLFISQADFLCKYLIVDKFWAKITISRLNNVSENRIGKNVCRKEIVRRWPRPRLFLKKPVR